MAEDLSGNAMAVYKVDLIVHREHLGNAFVFYLKNLRPW